jgi:hypothetical protein
MSTRLRNEPICRDVVVQLTGQDGNAFYIMGLVVKAMTRAHIDADVIKRFQSECKEGDYDHLLRTCMKYVVVE